jgi:WD40 repeat protein
VVSGGADQQLICTELRIQRPLRVFSCPAPITSVHISADAGLVACGAEDCSARIFDIATGRQVTRLEHDARVSCVSFAPDGTRLASGSDDHTACLFETMTGELLSQFEFDGPVTGVSFSPDGATLAASSVDGSVRLFETGCDPLIDRAIAALPRPLTRDELRRFGAQDDIRHVGKWNERTLRETTTP